VRRPASSDSIAAMSAASSSKSKTAMFSRIREGVTDFGMAMFPSCTCQRRITCAGVRPRLFAIATISGLFTAPRCSGLQASVAMPCSA